jgi:hypothetical protein
VPGLTTQRRALHQPNAHARAHRLHIELSAAAPSPAVGAVAIGPPTQTTAPSPCERQRSGRPIVGVIRYGVRLTRRVRQ